MNLRKGKATGLVGESGSGKSMTAFSLIRLFPSTAAQIIGGSIAFGGQDLVTCSEKELRQIRGGSIGFVFQDPSTYLTPVLTIGHQLEEQLIAHGRRSDAQKRIAEVLQLVGLSAEVAGKYPHELSGGMKQRVCIASALVCDPQLIVADEPTTALDVTIQAQILRLLKSVQEQTGAAMLLISHDLGIVAEVCHNVYIMYAGRIVEEGVVEDIFSQPAHPYTQGLLAGVLTVHTPKKIAVTIRGSVPDLVNPPSGCRFHPRCPQATERCKLECPPFFVQGNNSVSCWLYAPKTGGGQASG